MADKNEMIVENDDELLNLIAQYIEAKGDDYSILSMEDRVKLFLALVKDCDYKKESFVKVDEFKELFFPKSSLEKLEIENLDNYLTTLIIGEKSTKENKLVVLYSAQGVNNDECVDENNTMAFEISFKDHTVKQVSVRELKGKIASNTYQICKCCQVDEKEEGPQNLKTAFAKYLTSSNCRQA